MSQVRVSIRRGEVSVPEGESPEIELELAEGERLIGFTAQPKLASLADLTVGFVDWIWEATIEART